MKKYIIFLPGMLCNPHILWQAQKNYSANFIVFNKEKTLEKMFDTINHAAAGQFSLIGFSMGGYIAQEYILKYPEQVSDLVLISTCASGYTAIEKQQRLKLIQKVQREGGACLTGERLKQWIASLDNNHELLKAIENMTLEMGTDIFAQQQTATLDRVDRHIELQNITCPTLVLGGKEDKLISQEKLEKLARAIPNAQLQLLDNCGHMLPLEKPVELNEILDQWFLDLENKKHEHLNSRL
jgi:pimeloyl-ACP methyl ester carboxylesterase